MLSIIIRFLLRKLARPAKYYYLPNWLSKIIKFIKIYKSIESALNKIDNIHKGSDSLYNKINIIQTNLENIFKTLQYEPNNVKQLQSQLIHVILIAMNIIDDLKKDKYKN